MKQPRESVITDWIEAISGGEFYLDDVSAFLAGLQLFSNRKTSFFLFFELGRQEVKFESTQLTAFFLLWLETAKKVSMHFFNAQLNKLESVQVLKFLASFR